MLPYSSWLKLSLGTRHKMAEAFGFKKVKPTHVVNNEIIDDGFQLKDIEENLTIERLQSYLGVTGTDIIRLFNMAVDKVEGRIQTETPIQPMLKRKGRPVGSKNKTR